MATNGAIELATLLWQEYKFKLMSLETAAKGFEDIFTRVMRLSNPDHFHVSREGGRRGDRSCDGWDSSSKTLYSVYAPFSKKDRSQIAGKLQRDLRGAVENYPDMQRWRLVHNDLFGMHAEVTRALEDIRGDPRFSSVEILSDFGPQELWSQLERLSVDQRSKFFDGPHWRALSRAGDWDELSVRFHDDVPEVSVRAALRSLVQLCNNFEAGSVLDLVSAIAVSGASVVWWLNDEDLFNDYMRFLGDRSNESPMETQITALAFLLRCVEICARRLNVSKEDLLESQLSSENIEPGLRVIFEIARDEFNGNGDGIRVDDATIRFKFVQGCLLAVNHFVGIVSVTGYPALFVLQDLMISMQRIDYLDGIYQD